MQWPVLAPDQQKLLLAALRSNSKGSERSFKALTAAANSQNSALSSHTLAGGVIDPSMLDNSGPTSAHFPTHAFADGEFAEALGHDNDTSFDFLNENLDPPFEPSNEDGSGESPETGEKRKSPDDDDDDDEQGDAKRQDGDEKSAKKPGRKPLTSEPLTVGASRNRPDLWSSLTLFQKRKAQNRAAQRAFRERKEKHLKDLEQKVVDLEKSSESANHENGLLRAQIQRLTEELQSYRKRVSVNSNSASPPRSATDSSTGPDSVFNFDFPKFGSLQQALWPGGNSSPDQSPSHHGHSGRPSMSPHNSSNSRSERYGQATRSPETTGTTSNQNQGMFEPGFLDYIKNKPQSSFTNQQSGSWNTATNHQSQQGSEWLESRSGSHSNTSAASPNSSTGLKLSSSSCCTSPESSTDSPNLQKDQTAGKEFYSSDFSSNIFPQASINAPTTADFNLDWLASQNNGQFDPVLFGDYRESQDAVVGDGDFSNGLFDDNANAFGDFNDPFDFGLQSMPAPQQSPPSAPPQTHNLMEHVAAQGDGKSPGASNHSNAPPKDSCAYGGEKGMMTAHKIW